VVKKLCSLILFGIAFGFVEASVVSYLRALIPYNSSYIAGTYQVLLNLGVVSFIIPRTPVLPTSSLMITEIFREFSTIVMLTVISYLSAKKLRQGIGAFMVSFAVWDIFYYVFLRVLTGWPASFLDIDVYFLIPVAWVGPVITPVIISLLLFIFGTGIYLKGKE
jgi:hypothetical protein